MFTQEIPIGAYLYDYYESGKLPENDLHTDYTVLLDKITNSLKQKSIENVSKSFYEDIYNLRIRLLKSFTNTKAHQLENNLANVLLDKLSKRNNTLNSSVADALELYYKIYRSFGLNFNSISEIINQGFEFPAYKSFITLLSFIGGQNAANIKWILDNSLRFDVLLIIKELYEHDKIRLAKTQISQLARHISKTMEDYALTAYLIGIWQPGQSDETILVRNVKIRIALLEADQGKTEKHNLDTLKDLLIA